MSREAKVPRLEPIAPRVWLLRGGLLRNMNAYLIEDGDGVVVYDTGEKGMAGAIAASMAGRATAAHLPHEAYNLDTGRARESIRKLAALQPKIVGVGHLGPMTGRDVVADLERAAA
jgi:hypothetical protein